MFIYVSKTTEAGDPTYTYVYGDHEGVHKNAKVPFGLKLEVIMGPYDSAYEIKPPPAEYSTGLGYSPYKANWIAAADVSLTPPDPATGPVPEPEPLPGTELPGSLELAVAVLRAAGIKSITLG